MKNFFYNISGGNPASLVKPCLGSFFDGLCKILPAAVILDVINTIFTPYMNPGTVMDIRRLWIASLILLGWTMVQYMASNFAYIHTFTTAYQASASGRTALAEHLRTLPLGFLGSRDPGDLTTMMLGDYAVVEHTISHHFPQIVSGIIFPLLAFIGLAFINWKMALSMFAALPISLLTIKFATLLLQRLGKSHVKARVDSASRLQEYLLGMKEIKAHGLSGNRFARLDEAFKRLMHESIRIEGILGPVMMVAIALMSAGLPIMTMVGAYLMAAQELTLPVFLVFLLIGTRIFEPITLVLVNYAEIRYSAISAERIMQIRREESLRGHLEAPASGEIVFANVSFGYGAREVLHNISFP